ncbi:hypothetical protein PARA125_001931 [Parachlamydia sp. AcF125]|nr:hypothetical protein [Parachlamydia sp. AcF125]
MYPPPASLALISLDCPVVEVQHFKPFQISYPCLNFTLSGRRHGTFMAADIPSQES